MSGTDFSKVRLADDHDASTDPIVVLVAPQMGENIGATARAMMNCGLRRLRLVAPRDGWPNEKAEAMAAGAFELMAPVEVFSSTREAVADCHFVMATTARPRELVKPVFTADGAAQEARARASESQRVALLFGAERSGLTNDDLTLAHAIVTLPLNPGFSSLNLGQAVLLVTHAWYRAGDLTPALQLPFGDSQPARSETLQGFLDRLEAALEARHFFRSEDMRPTILRNLKALFLRGSITDQEVNTLHGVLSALLGQKAPPGQR